MYMARFLPTFMLCNVLLFLSATFAQGSSVPKASYNGDTYTKFQTDNSSRLKFAPLTLSGGTTLTIITQEQWLPIAEKLTSSLQELHGTFEEIFDNIPAFDVSIRLMDEEKFYRKTGAPRWTNALFYKGQIIIPLSPEKSADLNNVKRSIRHEYTHAVIHSLSNGTAPGWFDEGLAQWIEGDENPSLMPAMMRWLRRKKPISFSLLQGGFTGLQKEKVPVAYAQSLYSTKYIFNDQGLDKINLYLKLLRSKTNKYDAFKQSFKISEREFENQFHKHIKIVAKKNRHKYN